MKFLLLDRDNGIAQVDADVDSAKFNYPDADYCSKLLNTGNGYRFNNGTEIIELDYCAAEELAIMIQILRYNRYGTRHYYQIMKPLED